MEIFEMEEQKRFKSSADAAAFLGDDEQVRGLVEQEIENSSIVNALLQLRLDKGVSQKQLAQTMGCDASKISRLEAGTDETLRIGDIRQYLSALDICMSIGFEDRSLPVAEQIKQHVFAIHAQLESLVEIAKEVDGDTDITDKIHQFYGEVLFNFLKRFTDSHSKLRAISCPPQPALPAISKATSSEQVCIP